MPLCWASWRAASLRLSPPAISAPSQDSLRAALEALIAGGLSRSDAARQLAQQSGIPRRELYALIHTAEEPS